MPTPELDGLLTTNVILADLSEETLVRLVACIVSVAVFAALPASPKTQTATATASAIATAMSIIVATTFEIPLLFILFILFIVFITFSFLISVIEGLVISFYLLRTLFVGVES